MNDLDYFYKAITSPIGNIIGFVVFLYMVYIAIDFIRKGLKKQNKKFLIDDKNSKFDKSQSFLLFRWIQFIF